MAFPPHLYLPSSTPLEKKEREEERERERASHMKDTQTTNKQAEKGKNGSKVERARRQQGQTKGRGERQTHVSRPRSVASTDYEATDVSHHSLTHMPLSLLPFHASPPRSGGSIAVALFLC